MLVGGLLGPSSPALAAPIPTPPGSVTLTGAPGSLVLTWTASLADAGSLNAMGSDCSGLTGSATVLEPVVPQAPRALTASLPDGLKLHPWVSKFSISWEPPAFDGGMPLVGYVISVNGAQSNQPALITSC